jgi:hypothetical protein
MRSRKGEIELGILRHGVRHVVDRRDLRVLIVHAVAVVYSRAGLYSCVNRNYICVVAGENSTRSVSRGNADARASAAPA